ncbi:CaiB/BaiF CoA transferase family protein [Dongia rigui]|uniref:CaiB/BaiF CoA-transferase family protein n=1 Tax=Dongia rigui TaxID=940149 RepID=A0ABU5E3B7_9PROT|nr:CaiB/BaiF CoA-transferase family protein [Dongia rigui]MDY0873817.1 CaiB/BaiF CoA-transferase family protein [Dongia rigui]
MPHALKDVLVVALEQAVAAPIATSRLADAGARVIKLERPEGDFARGYDDYALGQSSYFVWMNRGKESCRVDLNKAEDRALVEAMIAKADIFIQNLAPGATDRLGLGSKDLRNRFPRLIVCDVSGYAPGTANYFRKAYDLLIQAEVGLAYITGTDLSGPSRVGISICDITTGQAAYGAILEALIRRDRTGEGSHLQVSLFDTIADYMNVPYLTRRYGGKEPSRLGLAHPSIAPYGSFRLKDGAILIAVQSEREWQILCRDVLHDPALAADDRFESNVKRVRNRAAVDACIQMILATKTAEVVTRELTDAKIAFGMVSTMNDLLQHESAAVLPVETANGTVEVLAPPVIIDGKRPTLGHVPTLGQHDEALRREFAPAPAPAP